MYACSGVGPEVSRPRREAVAKKKTRKRGRLPKYHYGISSRIGDRVLAERSNESDHPCGSSGLYNSLGGRERVARAHNTRRQGPQIAAPAPWPRRCARPSRLEPLGNSRGRSGAPAVFFGADTRPLYGIRLVCVLIVIVNDGEQCQ